MAIESVSEGTVMLPEKQTPVKGNIEQAGILLNLIAELASSVEQLTVSLITDEENSDRVSVLVAIKAMAQQIGWKSDLGAEKLGAGACFGDAEHWALPTSYHDIERGMQRAGSEANHV